MERSHSKQLFNHPQPLFIFNKPSGKSRQDDEHEMMEGSEAPYSWKEQMELFGML